MDWQTASQDTATVHSGLSGNDHAGSFSSITCPIYANDQLIAVGLCFQKGALAFKNIEKQAVQVFCQQAGVALENIQLTT